MFSERGNRMDGQNFENEQSTQNTGSAQFSNYQDNTANIPYQAPPEDEGPNKTNGAQIASLVLGIIAIPACCCYGIPGVIFCLIGMILAIVGNKRGKTGVGIAGLVCSIVGIVFGLAMSVYYGMAIYAAFQMIESGEIDINSLMRELGYY